MVNHVIIMAGGAGKRLWPASHEKRPKQFIKVQGEDSLFCSTVKRAAALNIQGNIVVVTHKNHIDAALWDASALPEGVRNQLVLLAEPEGRNTGPALAYAAAWLRERDGGEESSVLVLAADHLIQDVKSFARDVEAASRLAEKGFLVVYGIQPDFPSTGYGYIEAGAEEAPGYRVLSFKEKPDVKRAESFLAEGNYFWNSGMFTYRLDVFMKEMMVGTPAIMAPFQEGFVSPPPREEQGITILEPDTPLEELYRTLPKDSIDYALMEKSGSIAMVQANFDWNDVGSWDVIADLAPDPSHPVFETKGSGNFVYGDLSVAFCGVNDLIVVAEGDKLLICKKGESQLVKEAAEFFLKQS